MNLPYILFIHDHKFLDQNGVYYSEGKFSNSVFSRYNSFNCNINVISRVIKVKNCDHLNEITNTNICFKFVFGIDFSSIFTRYLFKNVLMIMREVKKSDALIIRLPSFLGVFALLINLFYRKKYFIEFVGDPKESLLMSKTKISYFFRFLVGIFNILNIFFVKKADGVIYVTKYDLQNKYPTTNMQSFASNVEVDIPKLEFNLDNYKLKHNKIIKVGMIGSFNNEYKGIDTAFKAIKDLKEKNIIVNFHILGSGSLKEKYINLAEKLHISDLVYFDGSLSGGKEVLNWLKDLDIYIQPSRTEGLPRALIEAMSVGLPCIATNVGGIPELLSERDLISKDDYLALAKKISDFSNSDTLRFEAGGRNYHSALDYDSVKLNKKRSDFWRKAAEIVYG
ncbi:glycosyltransferase [Acinetobacter sp. YH12041]|uniref:glycosyltransferase n=1 Tax=Acinetobacter sp. YH12041 TaxID=2601049 RepID=UPI0015D1161D|nr:glycosyltransferase [Acinetobacter sp. YH12041]